MKLEFGDMVFYSIAGLVVIVLLWLRFIEPHVNLWGALATWLLWTAFLVWTFLRGRRQRSRPERGHNIESGD